MCGETKEVTEFKTKTEKDTRTERDRERRGGEPGTGTVGAKALRRVHIYIQELIISAYM